jgi:hypothetical protein
MIHTDDQKIGLGEAFRLEPSSAATAAIGRTCMLRDNALKAMVSACLKERGTGTLELLAKLNAAFEIDSE